MCWNTWGPGRFAKDSARNNVDFPGSVVCVAFMSVRGGVVTNAGGAQVRPGGPSNKWAQASQGVKPYTAEYVLFKAWRITRYAHIHSDIKRKLNVHIMHEVTQHVTQSHLLANCIARMPCMCQQTCNMKFGLRLEYAEHVLDIPSCMLAGVL